MLYMCHVDGRYMCVVFLNCLLLLIHVMRGHGSSVSVPHGQGAVPRKPVHVELLCSGPLLGKPGVRGVTYGLTKKVVPKLGKLLTRWVSSGFVRCDC